MAEEDGVEPKALQERPELAAELLFLWEAWWLLTTDRPIGMSGVGPIPFSAIDRYAQRYRIDDVDAFEAFAGVISQMDDVYLAWQADRTKTKPQQP